MDFLSYLIGACLPDKNVVLQAQQIKYPKPVYLNDRLTLFSEIVDVHEAVDAIEFKFHFENQDKVKVAKGKFQIGLLK